MNLSTPTDGKNYVRGVYENITKEGLAYNLYKYAEKKKVYSLKVSDFYNKECLSGPYRVLGINKTAFYGALKALNSSGNRVLIAELAMGLDSITLREDLSSITCLEALIQNES